MKVNTLTLNSLLLPQDLLHMADPPKQLFYKGNLENFASRPRLAIVGSRKATPYGRAVTTRLAQELASQGIVIISGLALGIDSIAHQAALDVGGITVAVLACGLDRVYPASHTNLAKQLLDRGGAIISEYPEGTEPLGHQFIARNRLIAGLSDGVLITEAAEKSGSLHTANFALEQGKTVLAVPGNITSPTSTGANNLIKAGALPITMAEDVMLALGLTSRSMKRQVHPSNEHEAIILELLKQGLADATELFTQSHLEVTIFNQTLTMLEITGKIRSLGPGQWGIQ